MTFLADYEATDMYVRPGCAQFLQHASKHPTATVHPDSQSMGASGERGKRPFCVDMIAKTEPEGGSCTVNNGTV